MRPIRPVTEFIKKTLIFSKRVEKCHMKMLENIIKYRITMKSSYYFIELLVVAHKERVIGNETYKAWNSVYYIKIDFLQKSRLNSYENAWKQRKVQNHNEIKLLFHWITGSCSEIACYLQWDLLSLKQCLLNKHWFSPKGSFKFLWKCLKTT